MAFQLSVTQSRRFQVEFVNLPGAKPAVPSGKAGGLSPLRRAAVVQESDGEEEERRR